jgi:hypothetical protein
MGTSLGIRILGITLHRRDNKITKFYFIFSPEADMIDSALLGSRPLHQLLSYSFHALSFSSIRIDGGNMLRN